MHLQISAKAEDGNSDRISESGPSQSGPSQPETALSCLAKVAAHHGVDLSVDRLRHTYAIGTDPISQTLLLRITKEAGLRARVAPLKWETLLGLGEAYPALVQLINGNWVVVIAACHDAAGEDALSIFDPLAERPEPLVVAKKNFCDNWRGEVILVKRSRAQQASQRPFGFRWFVPELIRERRLLTDVAVAAVLLYALGLVTPFFFQLVIDKVLVHESFTTLLVLTAGAAIALAFDALFSFLRRYLLLYATNKVDIRVATKTFGHLLGLPISFFEHISAGVLVKHMQQARSYSGVSDRSTVLDDAGRAFAPGLHPRALSVQCQTDASCTRIHWFEWTRRYFARGAVPTSALQPLPSRRGSPGPSRRDGAWDANGQIVGHGTLAGQGLG